MGGRAAFVPAYPGPRVCPAEEEAGGENQVNVEVDDEMIPVGLDEDHDLFKSTILLRRPTCPSPSCWTSYRAARLETDEQIIFQLELPAHARPHLAAGAGHPALPPTHRPSKEKKKIVARRDLLDWPVSPQQQLGPAERDKCFSMSIPCSAEIANLDWLGHLSLVSNGSEHRDGSSKPSHKPTFGQEEQDRRDKPPGRGRGPTRCCSATASAHVWLPAVSINHGTIDASAPEWGPRVKWSYCEKTDHWFFSKGDDSSWLIIPFPHGMEPRLRRRRPIAALHPLGQEKGRQTTTRALTLTVASHRTPQTKAEDGEPSGEGGVPSCSGSDGLASKKARSAGSAKERGGDKPRKEDKDAPAAAAAGSCEQSAAAAAASSSWFEAAKPPSASLPAEYHPSEPLALGACRSDAWKGQSGAGSKEVQGGMRIETRDSDNENSIRRTPCVWGRVARRTSPTRATKAPTRAMTRRGGAHVGPAVAEQVRPTDVLMRGHRSPKILHKIRPRSDTIASLKVALYSLLKHRDKYRAVQAADQEFLPPLAHKQQKKAAQQQEQIIIQEGKEVAEGAAAPALPSSGAGRSSCPPVSPREVPRKASVIQLPPAPQQQSSEASAPLPRASSLRRGG
ncbi:unnamed protein product [Vitrella brassicaformis CCMP3155]|uniref:Uncharacterized protein n=1 Tax=Vitrella brassicaformis (strain CCMP3155) TaxID=1169540 RepID=A0A0G4FAQ9_VITBC|nr:unnamed protein product [Vitrella brassicaformis CCMP3155]|eukprot:CEM09713.1 unnamed protein product [Vitrella brassicaformis CCMP3155]